MQGVDRPRRPSEPLLRPGRRRTVFGEPLDQPERPGAQPRLHADIGQDLMRPLVRHGLRLAQGQQLRLVPVPLRLLVEKDAVCKDLVIRLDLRVDLLVCPEVLLRWRRSPPRAGTPTRAPGCRAAGRSRSARDRGPPASRRCPGRRRAATGRRSGNARSSGRRIPRRGLCRAAPGARPPRRARTARRSAPAAREAELAVGLDQHGLAAVLAVQAGHDAIACLVADAEPLGVGRPGAAGGVGDVVTLSRQAARHRGTARPTNGRHRPARDGRVHRGRFARGRSGSPLSAHPRRLCRAAPGRRGRGPKPRPR